MKIGILTSSRADYGIYKNLLVLLSNDERYNLTLIVFGMHLLPKYGNTLNIIEKDNYGTIHKVKGMSTNDSMKDISSGYGQLVINFSNYWNSNKFDCVIALGDRFEMSAAVQSGIPFEINFAHIHGGETTIGALDNVYRHQISLASKIHFTSTSFFSQRVAEIIGNSKNIHNVGSLSIENIDINKLPSWRKVCKMFCIPNIPFILVTFNPETVGLDQNTKFVEVLKNSLNSLSKNHHVVITQTNADAGGNLYRDMAINLKKNNPKSLATMAAHYSMFRFRVSCFCFFCVHRLFSIIFVKKTYVEHKKTNKKNTRNQKARGRCHRCKTCLIFVCLGFRRCFFHNFLQQ